MADSKNKASNTTDGLKSGIKNTEYVKQLGGNPPEKDTKAIDKQNSPSGRGRAPGSVRV